MRLARHKEYNTSTERKLGIFLSYGQTALNIIIALIYTPFMLRTLGKNEYGLYNTISSTIGTLSILDLGFSAAYIRYYTIYKVNNELEKIKKLNTLFVVFYFVIGLISFVCAAVISNHLDLVFDTGLTSEEQGKAKIMMIILGINMFITFVTTIFPSYISAHEKFIFSKTVNLLRTLLSPIIQLPIILLGYGSVGITFEAFALNTAMNLAYVYYAVAKLGFRMSFGKSEKGLFKSIFTFSGFIALNIIVDQVNGQLDNIIIARFCGTADVAVYSVGASLNGYYQMFSTQISGVFVPKMHKIVNETKENLALQRQQLTELFTKIGRLQFLVLALICSGLVFFGKDFIYLWAGEGYENAYWVAVMRVVTATVPLIQNSAIEIQRAQNKHYYRSFILFGGAIFNVILTVYLCQVWGSIGAAVGTSITAVTANGVIMAIVNHKKINIDMIHFWKNILRMFMGMLVPFAFGTAIMVFCDTSSWLKLALWIVVYSVIYAVGVWFLSMNKFEKELTVSIINKVLPAKLRKK